MKERRNLRWEEKDKGEMELNQLIQHFEIFNRSVGIIYPKHRSIKAWPDFLSPSASIETPNTIDKL